MHLKTHLGQGANSILGIGRASAHQFAEHGAKAIYICDYDDSNLEAHKREIAGLWPQVDVHTRKFDAADEKAVKEVIDDAVKQYGRLDVFFANAGTVGPHALFSEIDADDFMNVLRVNSLRSVPPPPPGYLTYPPRPRSRPDPAGSARLVRPNSTDHMSQRLPGRQTRGARDAADVGGQAHGIRQHHRDGVGGRAAV